MNVLDALMRLAPLSNYLRSTLLHQDLVQKKSQARDFTLALSEFCRCYWSITPGKKMPFEYESTLPKNTVPRVNHVLKKLAMATTGNFVQECFGEPPYIHSGLNAETKGEVLMIEVRRKDCLPQHDAFDLSLAITENGVYVKDRQGWTYIEKDQYAKHVEAFDHDSVEIAILIRRR